MKVTENKSNKKGNKQVISPNYHPNLYALTRKGQENEDIKVTFELPI